MTLKTRKNLKNWGKKIGLIIFALLFFLNIKIMIADESELINGDFSLLGVVVNLFEPILALEERPCNTMWCAEVYSCISDGKSACAYFLCNPGPGGFYCYYLDPDNPV
ncbi:MAG: hypothetical protein GYA14_05525 [Ignavibacteria bacterium]|nr:hypothetical protein [Ignavibacteria bacterium]